MTWLRYEVTSTDGTAEGKAEIGSTLVDDGHEEAGDERVWTLADMATGDMAAGHIVATCLGPYEGTFSPQGQPCSPWKAPVIAVLIPTYDRPDRIVGLATQILEVASVPTEVVFVVEADDGRTVAELRSVLADMLDEQGWKVHPERDLAVYREDGHIISARINEGARNYSGAANTGYRQTEAPYLFAGADDIRFGPDWDTNALERMDDWVMVVGTNDGLNPYVGQGLHATHYLIDRRYLDQIGGTVDGGPGSFLHEGYGHQYTDTEFIGTAKARARFRPCLDSTVEHLHAYSQHPDRAAPDATTVKAFATANDDSALYDQRRPLWQELSR
jgi:hypothetical protein